MQTSCTSSYCYWGYNYVTSTTNFLVYTPTSNFYLSTVAKNSGGLVYQAFGGSGGGSQCKTSLVGAETVTIHPYSFSGCYSTNNTAFVQYESYSASYLHFQADYN